jgi:predicted outer membrane repeat protein
MRFFAWLQKRKGPNQPPSGGRPHRPVPRWRPRLEALENRCLPSLVPVTSTLDDASRPGTLRYDIAHAASGDTIEMSFLQGAPIVLSQGELLLKKNVTIEGLPNQPETINGNHNSRVFEVAPKTSVTLIGLDITSGNGLATDHSGSSSNNGHGGGILNFGTLTVSNCTLSGNSVNDTSVYVCEGGAIANIAGTVNVSNSTLSGNSVAGGSGGGDSGGAIANIGDAATATVATVTVSNSILSGNSAAYAGGAIFNYTYGTVTVSNSTLSNNSAAQDGGAILSRWTATVSGCTLSGNSAAHDGGAILNAGTVTVSNSTLSGNSAGLGGAIYNDGGLIELKVTNSVFSSNSPDNIDGPYTDGGGNTGLP